MKKEFTFLSSDNKTMIHAVEWEPDQEPVGVILIAHGITEHIGRYEDFALHFVRRGFLVAGYDQIGHGQSIASKERQMCIPEGGWDILVQDMRQCIKIVKRQNIPFYLLGSSLGTFIIRSYLFEYETQDRMDLQIDGAILVGTGMPPFFALKFVQRLVKMEIEKNGRDQFSPMIDDLAFGNYNKKFRPNHCNFDWLNSSVEELDAYLDDPLAAEHITPGYFYEMLEEMLHTGKKNYAKNLNPDLSFLILSGEDDPVGDFTKGVNKFINASKKAGIHTDSKFYPGLRHDILHESQKDIIYQDIEAWLSKQLESWKRENFIWMTDLTEFNKKYNEPYGESGNQGKHNIRLSQEMSIGLQSPKCDCNQMVIGNAGSGKTRSFLIPNVLQANCSMVVMDDVLGTVLSSTRDVMRKEGYQILVMDLNNPYRSNHYSPIQYVKNKENAKELADIIIANTDHAGIHDNYYERMERLLVQAVILYAKENDPENWNFSYIHHILLRKDIRTCFRELEKRNPKSEAVQVYQIFCKFVDSEDIYKKFQVSLSERLQIFALDDIAYLTQKDDLNLFTFGHGKQILYIIPSVDPTQNLLLSMLIAQSMRYIKNPVHFYLDEFQNIGVIPEFLYYLETASARQISCSILIQSIDQLKKMYPDNWRIFSANCSTLLYMGGDKDTSDYIAELLGSRDFSLKEEECLVLVHGLHPYRGHKI